MAGITLVQAEAQLAVWIAASQQLATGAQSVTMSDGKTVTYAQLSQVQKQVEYWDGQCKRLAAGGGARIGRAWLR